MLQPDDVLVGFYTLFAKPEALRAFTENLLRKTKKERITAHNFLVLSHMRDPGLERQFGPVVASLPVPLFPPLAEFGGLNLALLREWAEFSAGIACTRGAGPSAPFLPSVYARPARTRPTGGEPFFEVQDLGGRAVVDMAPDGTRQLRRCNKQVQQQQQQIQYGSGPYNNNTIRFRTLGVGLLSIWLRRTEGSCGVATSKCSNNSRYNSTAASPH